MIYLAAEGAQIELIQGGGASQTFYKTFNHSYSSGSSGSKIKKIKKKIKKKEYVFDDSNDEDGYEKVITKTEIKIVKKKKTGGKGRYRVEGEDEYEYEEEEEGGGGDNMEYQVFSGAYSLYLSGDASITHRTPKSATCMTWNGNKFKTFDGLLYNQMLYCSHTLVQDIIDGTFSVVLKACSAEATTQVPCPFGLDVFLQNVKYSFDIKSEY